MISTLTPITQPRDFSLQGKIACYQKVMREWSPYLDPFELAVVMQIVDRTIGWGVREARFTTNSMLNGDAVYSGLKMGRAKLFKALASLEARGIVRRRPCPHKPDHRIFSINMDWAPDVTLTAPKRLKGVQPGAPGRPQHGHPQSTSWTTPVHEVDANNNSPQTVVPNSNHPGAAAPVSSNPADQVRTVAVNTQTTLRATRDSSASTQGAAEAAEAAWRLALVETFPGTAYRSWGVREKAQVKTATKTWRGDITFPEFIDWAVRNWTAIMRKQFKWMTNSPPPASPAFSFFIAFLTQFADCRAEGTLQNWLSDLDRTQLERMMGRGMTYEEATAELGRIKAATALREEMTIREVQVRARERGADAKLKQAQALAEMEGRAPVHPRSRAAEALRREAEKPTRIIEPFGEDEFKPLDVPMVDPDRNPFD